MPAPDDDRSALTRYARAAGQIGYLYGLPLVEMMRTAAEMTAGDTPLNAFRHHSRPATHEDRWVVTPANDLLYSTAWLDLSDEPMVLSVPAESARYWVVALLDAWTENFLNVGPRLTGGRRAHYGLCGPGWDGRLPEGVERVRVPTRLAWLLGRVLVDDETDLAAARALQSRLLLTPLSRFDGVDAPPSTDSSTTVRGPSAAAAAPMLGAGPGRYERWQAGEDPLAFFDNLARGLADNPAPAADAGVLSLLSTAGIRPGVAVREDLLGSAQAQALAQGLADGRAVVAALTRSRQRRPWAMNRILGRFGTQYSSRAAVAAKGLGGLARDEALYAMADFDAGGNALDGANRYRLHFESAQLPPVDAFWSVSIYDAQFFLVENPIARYAIGDRTRGLAVGPGGSLTIDIQRDRPARGASNWLPAPSGPFYLVLRMYHPREEARDGRYAIPPVTRVA